MEEEPKEEARSSSSSSSSSSDESGEEESKHEKQQAFFVDDENVLLLLDSMDNYLTLMDSFSATVRQGWLELASARHSMGDSRINGALFDLKVHPAATTLQVAHEVGSSGNQPHLTLHKWASTDNGKCNPVEAKFNEDELEKRSKISDLRHRGTSQCSDPQDKNPNSQGSPRTIDNQIQKERSKSLSMFGTLVSPKLRATQLSFETALETLVEVANMRSSILTAFEQIQKELEVSSNKREGL